MKIGMIIGIRVVHEASVEACALARQYSRVPIVAVFNGVDPVPVADGITVVHVTEPFGSEIGLWNWAYTCARELGWDWCAVWHDDFLLYEPGWEDKLEAAHAKYRIAVAGLDARLKVNEFGEPAIGANDQLVAFVDGCSVIFNVRAFALRGTFTEADDISAGGDLDVCCWSVAHGFGVYGIGARTHHHPDHVSNTRQRFKFGYDTKPMTKRWQGVLPVEADGDVVRCAEHFFDARRQVNP